MDPISMVLAALLAGACTAGGAVANAVVEDVYRSLKDKLLARLGGDTAAVKALERHASDPKSWESPLREALIASGAAEDLGVLRAAQEVLALVDGTGAQVGKYVADARGAQGVVIGDNAQVSQLFGTSPPRT